MKVSSNWLKELVDYQLSAGNLADQLSLSSIGVKQQTEDYLELDLTYNRGDLLSMRGVAYEVSAITNSPLRFLAQTPQDFIWVGKNLPKVSVKVKDEQLCPVYCVAKIEGLKIGSSNNHWGKKLIDCGIRSIDNITDITNLVMLEYGQTIHAFDADKVVDETMIVRLAKTGEKFITLDGKTRNLTNQDLLITDPKGILSLSGIMGGKNSEITDITNSILLEVAIFDPISIRKTSQRFGIHSEASKRIQHGLSKMRLLQALDAAIRMYQKLGGKLTALTLLGNFSQEKESVYLSIKKVNNLLGLKLDEETVTKCLRKLNFAVIKKDADTLEVIPPYFRMDIKIEEDLIEEIARIYGYEKIDGVKLANEKIPSLDQTLPDYIYDLKLKLKDLGLTEVQSYSFYSTAVLEVLGFAKDNNKDLIKIANPISSETEYMRMDLWPNLLEIVGKNIKQGHKDIGIFEIGKIYKQENGQPKENYRLSIALMNGTENPIEELASLIQSLRLHLPGVKLNPASPPKEAGQLFHPKRFINIEKGSRMIAGIAEVHLRLLNKLGIEKRVAVTEMNLEDLV